MKGSLRGTLVLIVGIVSLIVSLVAFRTLESPTAGVAALSFGIVMTGFGWHLRSIEDH